MLLCLWVAIYRSYHDNIFFKKLNYFLTCDRKLSLKLHLAWSLVFVYSYTLMEGMYLTSGLGQSSTCRMCIAIRWDLALRENDIVSITIPCLCHHIYVHSSIHWGKLVWVPLEIFFKKFFLVFLHAKIFSFESTHGVITLDCSLSCKVRPLQFIFSRAWFHRTLDVWSGFGKFSPVQLLICPSTRGRTAVELVIFLKK